MKRHTDNPKLKVLLIEDNPKDVQIVCDFLAESTDAAFELEHVGSLSSAVARLSKGGVDLILLDLFLPDSRGFETFAETHKKSAHVSIIILSGSADESLAMDAVRHGAQDYLVKGQIDARLLVRAIRYAIERKRNLAEIEQQKQRVDDLLHIILPHDVAYELKTTNAVKPRRFEHVGVLFCDVVEFTAFCDRHRPGEILKNLQTLVEILERLTADHGLEKIKTIGDSFMATAGLLTPVANPALKCVRCGLAMAAAAKAEPPHWQVRVGVHVGPVVAGIVGQKKYQYDLWGDTVNTAARMQRAADPGTVCVNGDTWKLLSEDCEGTSQGLTQIKGKGQQEIFRVDEVRSIA